MLHNCAYLQGISWTQPWQTFHFRKLDTSSSPVMESEVWCELMCSVFQSSGSFFGLFLRVEKQAIFKSSQALLRRRRIESSFRSIVGIQSHGSFSDETFTVKDCKGIQFKNRATISFHINYWEWLELGKVLEYWNEEIWNTDETSVVGCRDLRSALISLCFQMICGKRI